MALTKVVTKMFPTPNTVGIHLVIKDDERPDLGPGEHIVIRHTISRNFDRSVGIVNKIRDEIGREAQEVIDEYKKCKAVYAAASYDEKVTQIDNALTL